MIQDLRNSILNGIRTIFNIRRGEELRVSLLWVYIFLIVTNLMIIKPVCTAMFLSEFGPEQLPIAFLLVAICAAAFSTFYVSLYKKYSYYRIIIMTLGISILTLFFFRIFLQVESVKKIVLYLFYIWIAIFAVMSTSQFWLLVNLSFNQREAKRLFSFIGAGAIAGGIFGGYLTNALAPVIESENLLFICMLFFLLCLFIIRKLWNSSANIKTSWSQPVNNNHSIKTSPIQLITKSAYLKYIAGILITSVVVARFVEYQYSALASEHITNKDELTAFFGFWLSNVNLLSLFIQLFITRHVVGVFGVGTSLYFLPGGLMAGAFLIFIMPTLWSAVFIKTCDGSMKNSIHKAGMELLYLPVPNEIRSQVRPFIDVFGDSLASGLGGVILFISTILLHIRVQHLSILIIMALLFWFYLILQIRKEYLNYLRVRIEQSHSESGHKTNMRKMSIIDGYVQALNSKKETRIINALELTKEIRHARFLPSLQKLLNHPNPEIRILTLHNLYFYSNIPFKSNILKCLNDPNQHVKTEAMQTLFQHQGPERVTWLLQYLDHQNLGMRLAALLCIAREGKKNTDYHNRFSIINRFESLFNTLTETENTGKAILTKQCLAEIIGAAGIPPLEGYLYLFFRDSSPEVVRAAFIGAGQTQNKEFIPILLSYLNNPVYHESAKAGIRHYDPSIQEILIHFMLNPAEDMQIRIQIPELIASFGTQKSVNILIDQLNQSNMILRHQIVKALSKLKKNQPDLNYHHRKIVQQIQDETDVYKYILSVMYAEMFESQNKNIFDNSYVESVPLIKARKQLIHLVEKKRHQALERIFRLLGLRYTQEDMFQVYQGVQSKQSEIFHGAVEFLDNMLSLNLKRMVIPIVEMSTTESMVDQMLDQFGIPQLSESQCLQMILDNNDDDLVMYSLQVIRELNSDVYLPYLGRLLHHKNTTIKREALNIITKFGVK